MPLTTPILVVTGTAAALSCAAGFFLFQRHVEGRPLLVYEPRRRAPWGPLVLCIPLLFIFSGLVQAILPATESDGPTSKEFALGVFLFSTGQLIFVAAAMAWLSWDKGADRDDLGLSADVGQFWLDAFRGTVACLAALLPVLLLNLILTNIFQSEQTHPMIDRLLEDRSPLVLIVGGFSAVVAAPIFEEFAFRVLLQGWLEKLEDQSLNFQSTQWHKTAPPAETVDDESLAAWADSPEYHDLLTASVPAARPPHGWLGLLPHGWLPIFISGTLFGLAHLGHGLAPVPLVLLGIVLGYLYQRTHRLVPCVVAHMVFNSFSMVLLWLSFIE